MRILRIIDTLDPTHGGPIDSLINGTYTMEAIGHTTEIITLDDPTRFVPNGFPGVIHDLSPSLGKYRFNLRLVPWLVNHGAEYDAVIVEGVWQYPTFAVWLASRVNKFPYFMIV
ncbi:MAG TPA: hypothetical protein VN376_06955, partial [Longilinea sp.]|nr:hypothetical protein [Longilinea sp.]